MQLSITPGDDPQGRVLLILSGSLDITTRDALVDATATATAPGSPGVVLDLGGVEFLDSSGLGALVSIAGAADDADVPFALRDPSPRALRVLQVTGLAGTWAIETIDATNQDS